MCYCCTRTHLWSTLLAHNHVLNYSERVWFRIESPSNNHRVVLIISVMVVSGTLDHPAVRKEVVDLVTGSSVLQKFYLNA